MGEDGRSRCRRCGRRIWGAHALASGYGEGCRRRVYRAARVLEGSVHPSATKAALLLRDAGVLPHPHRRVYRTVGSSGRVYLTHPSGCTCPAGIHSRLCYHRVAVSILAQ
jgi:hypothetical protein